jgi:hypothetical protein
MQRRSRYGSSAAIVSGRSSNHLVGSSKGVAAAWIANGHAGQCSRSRAPRGFPWCPGPGPEFLQLIPTVRRSGTSLNRMHTSPKTATIAEELAAPMPVTSEQPAPRRPLSAVVMNADWGLMRNIPNVRTALIIAANQDPSLLHPSPRFSPLSTQRESSPEVIHRFSWSAVAGRIWMKMTPRAFS